jgi:iron complex transport system substrate-binding protein
MVALAIVPTACSKRQPPDATAKSTLRVISLTPSATELVQAVGAIDELVGVDRFSLYPPEVTSLPKVGDFIHPDLEAIVALHPDIVLCDSVQSRVITGLNSAGIRILPLPLQTVDDVRHGLEAVGTALDRPSAGADAVARLDAALARAERRARARIADAGRPPRVLFVVDRRPGTLAALVAAGPGTYLDDLITRGGGENVLHDAPARYVQITAEEVITGAPDVILDAVHDSDAARARADWNALVTVPAVRAGRVHILGDTMFVTPGPRLGEALERLADLMWRT